MFELHKLSFRARISLLSLFVIALSLPVGINLSLQSTSSQINAKKPSSLPIEQPLPLPTLSNKLTTQCLITGCSSQLCVDTSIGHIATDCALKPEFACYRTASCEPQADGICGWSMTPELQSCLVQVGSESLAPSSPLLDRTENASL